MKTAMLLLLVLPLGELAAQASIFEGTPGGIGDVVVLGAPEEPPPDLQGVLLLPIDCIGRTPSTELLPDRARLRQDVPGASRLSLPMEAGSLYKFRRAEVVGATFGYFVVTPDGHARSVFTATGTGPPQIDDPIPGKVAISADGTAMLCATTLEAAGNLFEVDLTDGSKIDRTFLIAPHAFTRNGLVLLESWGFGLTASGPYRFDRATLMRTEMVSVDEEPAWFGTDVVASADGSTVAFIAGEDPTQAHVYVCHRMGPATRVTDEPGPIAGAGFLPEKTLGPTMALSTDGSHVAWCTSGAWTECFVRESAGSLLPNVQVTRDELFDDTLNETGVIAFLDPDSFVLTVGWRDASEMARADMYRVDVGHSGALAITNLTGTSGLAQPPFDYGTLATASGIRQTPDGRAWVALDPGAQGVGRLLWIDSLGQAVPFLESVSSVELVEPAGDYLVAAVHRPAGTDFALDPSLDLVQIPVGGVGRTILVAPQGSTVIHSQGWRGHNLFGAILDIGAGEWLGRISVPSQNGLLVSNQVLDYGLTQSLTQDGSILSSVSFGYARLYFAWTGAGTARLYTSFKDGFVLPGI